MSCFFTDKSVKNFDDVQGTDIKIFKKFFAGMLKGGIYLAPSAYEAMFVSLAHSKEDIEKTVQVAQNVFNEIAGV
jgi:glutamate-1-semialdehyde 2,1-aminomutase